MRTPLLTFLAAVVLVLPASGVLPAFWATLLNMIGISAIVALGLVVLTGVGGMTSFGQAAFVGVAAYCSALLTTRYGFSPWLALPVVLVVTSIAATLIGLVTVRLSGHYLPLGTICWGMAVYYLFGNLDLLGGFNGISGIPPVSLFGHPLLDSRQFWPLVLVMLGVSLYLTRNLLDSRAGRAIRALRSGTTAAEAFGIAPARAKLAVFIYAGFLAGLAGWLFAHLQRSVTPTAFSLNAGIEFLLMAVIGGSGRLWGAVLGAAIVVLLKNALQDYLPLLFGSIGSLEVIFFGVVLVLTLQKAREGLWPVLAEHIPQRRSPVDEIATALAMPVRPKGEGPFLLEAIGINKRFGGLVAVNDVSFSLAKGEILTLLGPNGAGKSTTFNLLTGVLSLSSGEVRIAGHSVAGASPSQIAGLGVARTFQHVKLVPEMSVLENVALGTHLRGDSGFLRCLLRLDRPQEAQLLAEAARAIRRVGLADRIHSPADSLSLGETRIVEIARAICLAPRVLLLDEPAAGLRKAEKNRLAELLRELRAEGLGILLVEHDMDFVMSLTDRIVVLDFGTRIAAGLPDEIRKNPRVQEAYLGSVA
ncbi:ATP-binding cassette domain-containing protein [Frigidibacter albus]|uniref:ATP-binding cassette domain-containing protein n=1 Tax=Frigidibacter albus TaxID=1465486 RepID=A0A6L8VPQ2_9RHOB|nr:branched-chain amino acid ABC transporter ATP-binding protein/permease [Frigidibacter albus]MZQ91130.1 ATP-binding cassette domain-containing protein [Frigidibacter albus]NBE33059.1 ATP-binding cassette domain-containing protein [Frigidibacter albus]GGH62945.1 metal-dependent hydrolase [Frigidibacter albus]